jgi:hypothetical protein
MPSWFTNAQSGIANTAGQVYGATPAPGQTALAGVGQTFNAAQNPFTTAMGGLQDVYQGISTPFNADGTPNAQSPLGSLFASQYAKLDQILPQVTAKEGAAGIGSGNFNSLRGQTAVNTARAGALTTLAEQQNQAALNAQTQAIQALQGVGNVGSQYGTTGINLAVPGQVQRHHQQHGHRHSQDDHRGHQGQHGGEYQPRHPIGYCRG